jgi:hypothetical protein
MVNGRWTVFGDDHKAVGSGIAKDEREAKAAALKAIDELKKKRRKLAFVTASTSFGCSLVTSNAQSNRSGHVGQIDCFTPSSLQQSQRQYRLWAG